jgi:hypothetical protein
VSTQPDPLQPQPAQSGLSDNAAGALAYVTFIPAIIFLIVEPYNKNSYIKFHSWQSIFLGIAPSHPDPVDDSHHWVGDLILLVFSLGSLCFGLLFCSRL